CENVSGKEKEAPITQKMWSIGGGKGGTGKSFVTLSLAIHLARMRKQVIIIDADLGGANVHTLLGIRSPDHSLNDFLEKRVDDLNRVCIETPVENLKIISGGDDILNLANPKFSQKERILRNLKKLEADHILLDLGAGTSFNILDFFIFTQGKIVVVSPFPTSVQNAYGFIKSGLYRKLTRLFPKNQEILRLIKRLVDPGSDERINSVVELIAAVDKIDGESAAIMHQAVDDFKVKLIVNMTKSKEDAKVGEIIKVVSDKYLSVDVDVLASVPFDALVEKSIILANPLVFSGTGSEVSASIYEITSELLKTDIPVVAREEKPAFL
ncbi:MAG: P-loop NTPase, partial [Thermodesulfobacteriota bacterium]|nr:P-loop NTPase [Thermodesulfobacteriota bacterium]